ncbi:MAG: VPA1262 family N-terminal domain-containing protein [Spirochaetaceae bacterium]|nr:VPA1262 family N-terminal domain-containing protein [Spirochaetaceae bacterium]
MESTGYSQAVIHLAWFRDDHLRHLLFGLVELRPNEFPAAVGSPEYTHRATSSGRKYLYYRRFLMQSTEGIEWYRSATAGNPITLPCDPNTPTPGDGATLSTGAFVQEPCWPQTITSNDLPFVPDWMVSARSHSLFRRDSIPAEVGDIIESDRNRRELEDWLGFDIVDTYSEYQGAICIAAPNPVFRSVDRSLRNATDTHAVETVAYRVVTRQGQCPKGLRLEITNERVRGRLSPEVHEFDNDPIKVTSLTTRIFKEGISITHPVFGLLYWSKPSPFVRSIRTSIGMIRRRKTVEVPAGGRRRPLERYQVDEVGDTVESIIGETARNPLSRIVEAEMRRSRRQTAKGYDQEWFYKTPQEAIQFVRARIGSARDAVFIVDPYFAGRELLAFGHATSRSGVHIRILSSARGLRKSDLGETALEAGSNLQKIKTTTFDDYSRKPEIRILGDSPAVHDRFLVIDGSVWFSGNSLNSIGERAGMIVKLPDPEPVVERLDSFWLQARPLSEWLADRANQELFPVHQEHAV